MGISKRIDPVTGEIFIQLDDGALALFVIVMFLLGVGVGILAAPFLSGVSR